MACAAAPAPSSAKKISVINRDETRGRSLAERINTATDCKAEFIPWRGTAAIPAGAEILVNATSVGLYPDASLPDVDMSGVHSSLVVCDVIPNPPDTPFLKEARRRGAKKTITGQGMLVHQGAIGFEIWTGREAPLGVMKLAIQKAFGEE
jgi:shikimate dehydrogenase